MPSDVRSIDAIRQLHGSVSKLAEHWEDQVSQLRHLAYRFQDHVKVERRQYWQSQLRNAESKLRMAQEAMSRENISHDPADGTRNTETEILVAKSKRRVRLCLEKLALCKRLAAETDLAVDRFIGELGAMAEMAEHGLPVSAGRLTAWIEALDRYADTQSPPPTP